MQLRQFLLVILMGAAAVLFLGATTAPALAGPNGTTSGGTTANALPTGDTFPHASGEMSVRWTNTNAADTQYADSSPGNVETTVDTGFDMSELVDPADKGVAPGDSVVYEIAVQNLGNNAQPVPFNFNQTVDSGVQSSFTWELYHDKNDNDQYDPGTDNQIADTTTDVMFQEDETDTLYAVITAAADASNGDTLGNNLFATDNAPLNGAGSNDDTLNGDQWERGTVIASADTYDTQNIQYRTTVTGPVLEISKSLDNTRSSGSYRPGDTVAYRVTVTNTGGDTATNVEVVDAMPDSTTLSTVNGDNVTNGNTISSTEGDSNFSGTFDQASPDSTSERIKWAIDTIGPSSQSNNQVELTFRVNID
jgi:uncharacterized repeat protein (TIGR01451 family)